MRKIEAGDLTIRGSSTAGVCTSLHIPQLKVVLDAGIAHPSFAKEENILLSHCHMDHIGSLLALLGNRDLKRLSAPTIFVPMPAHEDVSNLVTAAYRLGRFSERAKIRAISSWSWPLPKGVEMVAFDTHHVVPSNGYLFRTTKKKLKPKYVGLEGVEIGRLHKEGVEVNDWVDRNRLAYITDTTSKVWDTEPMVLETDVLVMECTFLDDDVTVESARKHGHIHIDEIAANADRFKNKYIVLMHFSVRYSNDDIRRIVDAKLPADLRERVQLLLPEDE